MTHIEVIDDTFFLWDGIRHASESAAEWSIGIQTRSWMDFSGTRASDADLVIVSAELVDHVPVVLKARAILRLGTQVGVLINTQPSAVTRRLEQEGTSFVAGRKNTSWQRLIEYIDTASSGAAGQYRGIPGALSDRELQVAALFASRAAPTCRQIGDLLGLHGDTVRTHLKLARRRLSQAGRVASSREDLRAALLLEGYLVEEF